MIPCYNQAHFLPEAVRSVCDQTFQGLAVVIVDDGSDDDTADVAAQLAAEHPERPIQLLRQHNQGLPAARNRAIEKSDSEYILPLDADDKIDPDFVERCVAALDSHPEASIAYGAEQHFGEEHGFYPHGPYDFVSLTHINQLGVVSMFRRRAWDDVGGYSEHLCSKYGAGYEDWDFWVKCGEHGHFGTHVADAVFWYRVRSGSLFAQADDQRFKAHVVLNHPVLFSPEQLAWARGVLDGDAAALAIDGPRYQVPILGTLRVRAVRAGGAITGARALSTLALADELLHEPDLLRAYSEEFNGNDDATLVILGTPGELGQVGRLAETLSIENGDSADLLGVQTDDPVGLLDSAASMVDALLTRKPRALPIALPRIDASHVKVLRARLSPQVRV